MTQRSVRVCLLSTAPLCVNPRLRKEAEALHGAGHDVVVGYRADAHLEADDALLAAVAYRCKRLDYSKSRAWFRWLTSALVQRLMQWAVRVRVRWPWVDAVAYCRGYRALVKWAVAQEADFYIAHTHAALPVIARAAEMRGVPFAFDCEDLLAQEASDGGLADWRRDLILRLEARYLSRAKYVSTPSRPMAKYLVAQYGLRRAQVWHNCFSTREWEGLAAPTDRPRNGVIELAWISATIGPGRGLEDIGSALAQLPPHFKLHVYGALPARHATWFADAVERGDATRVFVHALPSGPDVVRHLARHHIGLSLDHPDCVNRALTVCNKLFLYLHAGLACVATRTPGHVSVLGNSIGAMYTPGDVQALVSLLSEWGDPQQLLAAQMNGWEVGQIHYTWDVEQQFFLDSVA